jgi:hypothetical protein
MRCRGRRSCLAPALYRYFGVREVPELLRADGLGPLHQDEVASFEQARRTSTRAGCRGSGSCPRSRSSSRSTTRSTRPPYARSTYPLRGPLPVRPAHLLTADPRAPRGVPGRDPLGRRPGASPTSPRSNTLPSAPPTRPAHRRNEKFDEERANDAMLPADTTGGSLWSDVADRQIFLRAIGFAR